MRNIFFISYCFVILTLFFPADAFAYFDPGTGSILLQALAAGLIAVGAFWQRIKEKIMSFFDKNKDGEGK